MTSRTRKLLAPALSLSLLAVAFRFDAHGIDWFWSAQPGVAIALAVGGALCWLAMLAAPRQRHD